MMTSTKELSVITLVVVIAGLLPSTQAQTLTPSELPYVSLGTTDGVEREYVGHFDDGVSHAINIPDGFPFGNMIHSFAYVGTNGIISFSEPFYTGFASAFPGFSTTVSGAYIVASYWDDVDISLAGNISYEVHTRRSNSLASNKLLDDISAYVGQSRNQSFTGAWMLVAEWEGVHPWPHGLNNPFFELFFPEIPLNNTWQGLVITDGTSSYAIFTYRCGDMNWAYGPTIGFNAAGEYYVNHPNTGSPNGEEIACLNSPTSQWYNLVYMISNPNATYDNIELPTVEPPQSNYLSVLELTNATGTAGTLPPCQNCTVAVSVPDRGFPFGSYYHSTIYVGTNGIFSIGRDFRIDLPEQFPSSDADVYYSYLVAPYWSNIDTRLEGQVNYEVFTEADSSAYLGQVSAYINANRGDTDFDGNWMLVATWDGVHPFPHGNSAEQDREDPYLQSVNTFQGILITNGTQSYSIFTYVCDQMEWSDEAVIGYNAGGEYNTSYTIHPLSGTLQANAIDCVHVRANSSINNVVYDLVIGELNDGPTPVPPSSLGSCVGAGYSSCCEDDFCLGDLFDCYCDEFCYNLGDCCTDLPQICSVEAPIGNDTYLVFGTIQLLSRVSLTGSDLHVLVHQTDAAILGVDFDYGRGYLYWSEGIGDVMYRSNMDGSNVEVLLNTSVDVVDDIAMDWIGNNLYWTDAVYARIEVMDIDTGHRMELLRTGTNTIPRAIVVDPSTRYMYWTDWGGEAKIERASMDGSDRRVLHDTGLTWPNGLTIDYTAQRIYWVDASLDKIEYSNVDGSGRFELLTQLDHPFSITLEGDMLFWTDWFNQAIHVTHKLLSSGETFVYNNLRDRPFGIEAVTPTRQNSSLENPCDGSPCTFICLLSATNSTGYSCACPDGYELSSDGVNCIFFATLPPPSQPGSCVDAGYQNCCTSGYCAGSPPNCACDAGCHQRGTCCSDIDVTCPAGLCSAVGYRACCTDGSSCLGSNGCYCDFACTFFGDCCLDFEDLCPVDFGTVVGSCEAAGYSQCCSSTNETDCLGSPANCKCDADCRDHGDCCSDIATTCPLLPSGNFTTQMTWLPYLTLRSTPGVTTVTVPPFDDGTSVGIPIPTGFPIGNANQSIVYVGTNGIISFEEPFTHHIPSLFPSEFTFISSSYLLAPFWSDVDITIFGSIFYEVHNSSNSSLIQQVNNFISNYTDTEFTGTWMLVAQYDEVRQFPGFLTIPTNTYQAIAITDGFQSYAVYTYRCGDLQWSGGATIGYNGGPIGNFSENHPLSGDNANSIACINTGVTEYSNVVYNVSIDDYISTDSPPTIEPPQSVYLEFLERTANSTTMPRCDDCVSDAIDLSANPVPFGDLYHSVAHIATNGIISFGSQFPHFAATLFPNENNPTVFNSYVAAPFWGDIDNRNLGEIWYDTHTAGQNSNSDSLLASVSNLVRSEQNLSSFQGTWMLVATWNSSVPFAGTGEVRNTFQGIVITDGNKTYAVYTYLCDDVQWSDGSVIGFNAGGSYYTNHPLSDSISARDIDCVHSPDSEWNNVVYDVNPNGTVRIIPPASTNGWLPFLSLNSTPGVTTLLVPAFDDDSTPPIPIPIGFPIGNTIQSVAFIGTNGMISFQQPFTHHVPFLFPSEFTFISSSFILAPFWSDVDIREVGSIQYEVHTGSENSQISLVNQFISNYTNGEFAGTWMLLVQWDQVPPFPGSISTTFNTYQAIAITDGSQSYAVYTYRCGDLQWSGGATIGYNGGSFGGFFENHPLSGPSASTIACINLDITEWSNVVYNVSIDDYIPTDPPPTIEPPQAIYLEFLERTNNSITMRRCDDCSSDAIDLSALPVPFGDYYHYVAHITSNGLISFGQQFPNFAATIFPNELDQTVFTAFLAAPYWSDIDYRNLGDIWYETHTAGQNSNSDSLLTKVTNLVRSEQNLTSFQGQWMLVATWNGTVPFAGSGSVLNTFQGIVITDGNKTYAVYTYHCDDVQWSDGSVIGFNAAGSYYTNHPLSGLISARDIDCVHSPDSEWNNVVYDVNPNGTTIFEPPPLSGSCAEAGYTECCTGFICVGQPINDCFCDSGCRDFGDCCYDIDETCPITTSPPVIGNSLLIANSFQLLQISVDGAASTPIVPFNFNSYFIGLDIDYRQGYAYYSDQITGEIARITFNGSSTQSLATLQYEFVEDLAVDWIANNLYWTDGQYNRIEVFDLDTMNRAVLIQTGPNTGPRGIVVDPKTRYMYWSDWGEPAKIERASMDGSNREVLHNTGLTWPNGLAIDYDLQRLYWADAFHDRIEYSGVDGVGREILLTVVNGLHHPFAITISGDQVYWTDWSNFTVYTAHKQSAISILPVYDDFFFLPNGIEAIDPNRQSLNITNYCDGNSCSHLCLLSSSSPTNYSCACPEGSSLLQDGLSCTEISNVTVGPPQPGSCVAAGYTSCCEGGYCAGFPPTCYCEPDCLNFRDCCDDFDSICSQSTTPSVTTQATPTTAPRSTTQTTPPTTPPLTTQTTPPTTPPPTTQTTPPTTPPPTTQTTPPTTPPSTTQTTPPTTPPPTTQTTPPTTPPSTPKGNPPTTAAPLTVPGAVSDLAAVTPQGSDTTLTVFWSVPATESSSISWYYVIVTNYSLAPVTSIPVPAEKTSTILTGLSPFIPYNITVVAYNSLGNGTASTIVTFTREGVSPVAPSNIKVEVESDTKITVTWDRLTPEDAWGFVLSYTVSYKKEEEDTGKSTEKTVDGTMNSVQIDNLDTNQGYIIVMWANTTAGMGQTSQQISTKTTIGANVGSLPGSSVAGIVIAVIIGLGVVALVILVLVWLFRKHSKNAVQSYDIFSDSTSINSGNDGDLRPRLGSYQQSTGFFSKKKKLKFDSEEKKIDPTSYQTVADISSFDNPVYESNPQSFALPGVASYEELPGEETKEDLSLDQKEMEL